MHTIRENNGIWTIGFLNPVDGSFEPLDDHTDLARAKAEVSWLNGGLHPAASAGLAKFADCVTDNTYGSTSFRVEKV